MTRLWKRRMLYDLIIPIDALTTCLICLVGRIGAIHSAKLYKGSPQYISLQNFSRAGRPCANSVQLVEQRPHLTRQTTTCDITTHWVDSPSSFLSVRVSRNFVKHVCSPTIAAEKILFKDDTLRTCHINPYYTVTPRPTSSSKATPGCPTIWFPLSHNSDDCSPSTKICGSSHSLSSYHSRT